MLLNSCYHCSLNLQYSLTYADARWRLKCIYSIPSSAELYPTNNVINLTNLIHGHQILITFLYLVTCPMNMILKQLISIIFLNFTALLQLTQTQIQRLSKHMFADYKTDPVSLLLCMLLVIHFNLEIGKVTIIMLIMITCSNLRTVKQVSIRQAHVNI